MMYVYRDGKRVQTMRISAGMATTREYTTTSGVHLTMERGNPVRMISPGRKKGDRPCAAMALKRVNRSRPLPAAYFQSGTPVTLIVSSSGRSNPKCSVTSARNALRSAR